MDTSSQIKEVTAQEILDSRGTPTIETRITLESGATGKFAVPSGESTGLYEAVELRDGNKKRYHGKGVLKAVENVTSSIAEKVIGLDANDQEKVDKKLLSLDRTKNKSKLGANSILSISVANAKAAANHQYRKLYNYLNGLLIDYLNKHKGLRKKSGAGELEPKIPTPMFNIMNGGAHADNNLSIQEFMVIPVGIKGYSEKLRAGAEINYELKQILKERGATTGVGDEGGFAPSLPSDESAIEIILDAIQQAGYKVEDEIKLGLDIASSQYWEADDKVYAIPNLQAEKTLVGDAKEVIEYYMELANNYPIMSIEDGLYEDDWSGWSKFAETNKASRKNLLIVGDDLTVTNPKRLDQAVKKKAINGIIIKPNQVGTLSEVFEVIRLCRQNDIEMIFSHRSGETTDTFIADLAVASGGNFIKDGAPTRGERVAKYNRLLEIEGELTTQSDETEIRK